MLIFVNRWSRFHGSGSGSSKIRSRRGRWIRRGTNASRDAAVDLGFRLLESSELFWDFSPPEGLFT